MIDVLINENDGSTVLTVAHDDRSLDGFLSLEIGLSDGVATLTGPAGNRRLGRLKPAMMEMVGHAMSGRLVRFAGWSIAKISPLTIRTHA